MIHAVEEEYLIPPAVNAFALPETGMEVHALSAQTLKSGQLPSWFAFAPMETGTEKPVSNVQPIKSGTQPP